MPDDNPSPQGHLAAGHIMIGDVGVFAGTWAANDQDGRTRYPTGFVGRLEAYRGRYAIFSCDREIAEAIVADQERLRVDWRQWLHDKGLRGTSLDAELDLAYPPLRFDGDDIVLDERLVHGETDGLSRISPDSGRYVICGWTWDWLAVDPADCDRIAGTPPAADQQPARIRLVHSPLHVPHGRLTVTDLHELRTYNGIAFTATLCLDGTPVGVIENDGNGGDTWLRHHNPTLFSPGDLYEFVTGCRHRGRPTDTETVLNRLVTEYDLARQVTALPRRNTLARTVDDDGDACGDIVTLTSLHGLDQNGQPHDWTTVATFLATVRTSAFANGWQVWLGDRWTPVPAVNTETGPGKNKR